MSLRQLEEALLHFGVPAKEASYLTLLNTNCPKPPKGELYDTQDPELWENYYFSTGKPPRVFTDEVIPSTELFGLTQGSPLSPILCNIVLEYSSIQPDHLEGVQYADDGL